jgi:hypothetical protein
MKIKQQIRQSIIDSYVRHGWSNTFHGVAAREIMIICARHYLLVGFIIGSAATSIIMALCLK